MSSNEASEAGQSTPLPGLLDEVEKLNLDPADLAERERIVAGIRIAELERDPTLAGGDFTFGHLQAIHAYILQDTYAWAGRPRTIGQDTTAFGMAHCRPEFLDGEIRRVFGAIDSNRPSLADRDAAIATVAEHWGELTGVHPFRDGNSRSQRVFFHRYLNAAGWDIDWRQLNAATVHAARHVAMATVDSSYLAAALAHGIKRLGESPAGSLAATQGDRDEHLSLDVFREMLAHRRAGKSAATFTPASREIGAHRTAHIAARGTQRRATSSAGRQPDSSNSREHNPRRRPSSDRER